MLYKLCTVSAGGRPALEHGAIQGSYCRDFAPCDRPAAPAPRAQGCELQTQGNVERSRHSKEAAVPTILHNTTHHLTPTSSKNSLQKPPQPPPSSSSCTLIQGDLYNHSLLHQLLPSLNKEQQLSPRDNSAGREALWQQPEARGATAHRQKLFSNQTLTQL